MITILLLLKLSEKVYYLFSYIHQYILVLTESQNLRKTESLRISGVHLVFPPFVLDHIEQTAQEPKYVYMPQKNSSCYCALELQEPKQGENPRTSTLHLLEKIKE